VPAGAITPKVETTSKSFQPDSFTVGTSLVVPAGGYVVLGAKADPALNGGIPVDYEWSGFSLANKGDEIVLSYGGADLDSVGYTSSWPFAPGVSTELSPLTTDVSSNDDPANWCESTTAVGTASELGTPGAANDPC